MTPTQSIPVPIKIAQTRKTTPKIHNSLRAEIGREIEKLRAQTPILTSPIGCSTETATNTAQPDQSGTPIRGQETNITASAEEELTGKPRSKQKIKVEKKPT